MACISIGRLSIKHLSSRRKVCEGDYVGFRSDVLMTCLVSQVFYLDHGSRDPV